MIKQVLNDAAHGFLRTVAHRQVNDLHARDLRRLIHLQAPVLGRIYTLFTSEASQRARVHQGVSELSRKQLSDLAAPHLPGLAVKALRWLDR